MKLIERQVEFARAVPRLIIYAFRLGYEVTLGDAYRDRRVFGEYGEKKGYGSPTSYHKLRLAIDLNIFINGEYQVSGAAHRPLHDYWESLGGMPENNNDMNHYQWPRS